MSAAHSTADAGRTDAPERECSPIIRFSTMLSTTGTHLVETSGYLDALSHLDKLDEYDAIRPRNKIADVRGWLKKIATACDDYEAALAAAKGAK